MKNKFIVKLAVFVLMGLVLGMSAPGAMAQVYNNPPVWNNIANLNVEQGQTISTYVSATDNNADWLTYAGVNLPDGAVFNTTSQVFSFTPNHNQLGSFPITLSVTDSKSLPVYKTFYVGVSSNYNRTVSAGGSFYGQQNQPPYITATNSYYAVNFGNSVDFKLYSVDPEGSSVFYTAQNMPIGATFNQTDGRFYWAPVSGQRGVYKIQFYVSDRSLTSVPFNVTIVVDGGVAVVSQSVISYQSNYQTNVSSFGEPYFVTSPSLTAVAGQTYVYNAQAYSPSGNQITYALELAPTGAYINSVTGVLAWTAPTNAVAGQANQFTVIATDARGLSAKQTFSLYVTGGVAVTNTNTIVRYVSSAPTVVTTQAQNTNANTVYVNTAHTIVQAPYNSNADYSGYKGAFNIKIQVNENQETIVSWDTNAPAKSEVVFGYSSQNSTRILNYEFTTGSSVDFATSHQVSLGKLEINRTYYMRVINRTGGATNIGDELIFIPMPYSANSQQIIIPQPTGAASSISVFGSMFNNGLFLLVLILIIFGLIIYLVATPSKKVRADIIENDESIPTFEPNGH